MILEELKAKIVAVLKLSKAEFSYPPRPEMGDISLACFDLAQERQLSPAAVAAELAEQARADEGLKVYFKSIEPVGPYLNFSIAVECLARQVLDEVGRRQGDYGSNQVGIGRKVMIEYSNGNTHKEYHVGHLRNIAYGDAVCHLLAASGCEAIPVSYVNDFGIHVAKTIWQWQRNKEYRDRAGSQGYLLGQCYADASRALAADPTAHEEVGHIMKQIESRIGESYQTWKETRLWSIRYFAEIYKELGVKFRHIFYENEVIGAGLKLVAELTERGILKKSQGAIIADLEEYGLGVLPVVRSDGTALYAVADLALASEKFRKYGLDESVYIVDVRQSLYFKQLFKILELVGFRQTLVHLTYDFVTLPEGMMASRTGNVISYQELRDKVVAKLTKETAMRHSDWSSARIARVVHTLAVASMKFEMLKVSPDKTITFNIEEALRFDGYTACYLEYGYARFSSIIRKRGFRLFKETLDPARLTEAKEKELLIKIAKYPKTVWLARENHNPSEITKYLFELVQLANDYYHEINILKADPPVRAARLALTRSIVQVLRNGFTLLGIKPLDEM